MKAAPKIALALCALCTVPTAHADRLCLEAETGAVKPVVTKIMPTTKAGAVPPFSGRGFLAIAPAAPLGVGSATFKLNLKKGGAYFVWARTFWMNGVGNSILLTVNGSPRILGEDGTYGKWHWVYNPTPVKLKTGANTIVLGNRESGVQIDQILFTSNPDYCPTKTRAVTHDGATGKALK